MARFENILGTIGNTPSIKINKLGPKHVNMFVKMEAFNPMASVKDRLALAVIEDAEKSGKLKPGQTVIEATSGNTGIGLAMVCAQKGYPLVVTMAASFSIERRKLMRYLGAKVVITPAPLGGQGMYDKAVELAKENGWFLARQFENEANADFHSKTTAEEILNDFSDIGLDYWVTGYGTGGTLKGVARVLREKSPKTKIIATEPAGANLLESGIQQARNADGSPAKPHEAFSPHPLQGWTPNFISKLTEDAVNGKYIDELITVEGPESIECAQRLAREEGVFVGISAGGTFAAALKAAENAPEGSNILVMLPDTGERYLSTPLFDGIEVEMNEAEIAISKSTPSAQMD